MQTDTTLNYQALALNIVMAAIEDSYGCNREAQKAQEWLENFDISGLGIEGLELSDLETTVGLKYEGKWSFSHSLS